MSKALVAAAEAKGTIKNMYQVMLLLEAKLCNPNGDPDMANLPRQDMETGIGIITDCAIKRRIRNYVDAAFAGDPGMDILMRDGTSLNKEIARAVLQANDLEAFNKKFENCQVEKSAAVMSERFWDVRTFGGVLSTGRNAGQITGPVQVAMSESFDPIHIEDMTITRMCYTDGKECSTMGEYEAEEASRPADKKRTMGEKKVISYGLYLVKATISPNLAMRTGFSEADLEKLFEAMLQMYEFDNTASKQGMSVVSPLIIFKHVGTHPENPEESAREALLGCAPAHKMFRSLHVSKKEDVAYPRKLEDYDLEFEVPADVHGVEIGVKTAPFDAVIWENEQPEALKKAMEDSGIRL